MGGAPDASQSGLHRESKTASRRASPLRVANCCGPSSFAYRLDEGAIRSGTAARSDGVVATSAADGGNSVGATWSGLPTARTTINSQLRARNLSDTFENTL